MEMTPDVGIYNEVETKTLLPTPPTIKQALLNLDYSQGAISNRDAAQQLAEQFCLSNEQRTVKDEKGRKHWIKRVNIAIQELVVSNEVVRPKRATIITSDALIDLCKNFVQKLGYEFDSASTRRNQEGDGSISIDIKTMTLKFQIKSK